MATVRKSVIISKPAGDVWDAVGDVGQLHSRVAPGMVTDTKLEEDGEVRIVTFANAKFSACITMRLDMNVRAERTTFRVAPRQNGLQSQNNLLNIRGFIDQNCFNVIGVGNVVHELTPNLLLRDPAYISLARH